jgi:3-dehydroquinate dehydratase/shikimate dehydrogenase
LVLTAEKTMIVGSFAPASMAEARAAAPLARGLAAVEVRLDAFREPEDPDALRAAFEGKVLVATLRSAEEGGGYRSGPVSARERLSAALRAGFDLVDVEFRAGENAGLLGFPPSKVIVSAHDVEGLPPDLPRLVSRMAATGARFVKIVGTANDSSDAARLLEEQGSFAGSNASLFGMGEAGMATRVLSPYLGAPLAFASFAPGGGTAPGQIAAGDLDRVYGVGRARRVSRVVTLFGSRVSHSLSPAIHNARFESLGDESLYVPFALRSLRDELAPLRTALDRIGLPLAGASVTIPFKEEAALLAGESLPVNTLLFSSKDGEEGGVRGANTDRIAFEEGIPPAGAGGGRRTALVLGAGGTARTAVDVLRRKGYEIVVSARDAEKGRLFAARSGVSFLSSENLPSLVPGVLVNATPLGLGPDDPLPCDAALLGPGLLVLDAPYREGGTALARAARARGCEVVDGFALLLAQAAGQATLFCGRETTQDDLLAALPAVSRPLLSGPPGKASR